MDSKKKYGLLDSEIKQIISILEKNLKIKRVFYLVLEQKVVLIMALM